jgi:hypothetical protein
MHAIRGTFFRLSCYCKCLRCGTVERYGSDEFDGSIILIPEKYMQNEAKNFGEGSRKYFMTSELDFWKNKS